MGATFIRTMAGLSDACSLEAVGYAVGVSISQRRREVDRIIPQRMFREDLVSLSTTCHFVVASRGFGFCGLTRRSLCVSGGFRVCWRR